MFSDVPTMVRESQLKALVDRLIEEDGYVERERRSAHRTPLVRPVAVTTGGNDETKFRAFSKNISSMGLGLIHEDELAEGTIAKLNIHCLSGPPVSIRSQLRWCQKFGDGWFLTGWNFLSVVRG